MKYDIPLFIILLFVFNASCSSGVTEKDIDSVNDNFSENDSTLPDDTPCTPVAQLPAEPLPPEPVIWGNCPMGWEPAEHQAGELCEPVAIPLDCSPGELPVPGRGCIPLGTCNNKAETAVTITINPGESLQAAIDTASDNSVIFLTAGTHSGPIVISGKKITLTGDCAANTMLTQSDTQEQPLIDIQKGTLIIRDIHLSGGLQTLTARKDSTLILERCEVSGFGDAGIALAGNGVLEAEALYIHDGSGSGMTLADTAAAEITSAVINATTDAGIALGSNAAYFKGTFSAVELFISAITPLADGTQGKAFRQYGGNATIANSLFEDVAHGAVSIMGTPDAPSTFTAELLIIRDVHPTASGIHGYGLAAVDNSVITLHKVLIEKTHAFGLSVIGGETCGLHAKLTAENLVIQDIEPEQRDNLFGRGMSIEWDAEAQLSQIAINRVYTSGLLVVGMPQGESCETQAVVADAQISAVSSQAANDENGEGIVVFDNAELALTRVEISKIVAFGLLVSLSEPSETMTGISAQDISITDCAASASGAGVGIGVFSNATAAFERITIRKSETVGFYASGTEAFKGAPHIMVTDALIEKISARSQDGEYGIGLALQYGTTGTLKRIAARSNHEYGFFLYGAGTSAAPLILQDITAEETLPRTCISRPEGCSFAPGTPMGHGIGIYENSYAALTNTTALHNTNGLDASRAYITAGCTTPGCFTFDQNQTAANMWEMPQLFNADLFFSQACMSRNGTTYTGDSAAIPEPVRPDKNK